MHHWMRFAAAALVALLAHGAEARDERLLADMVALEKAYINPLFFTSGQNLPKTNQTFAPFVSAWQSFARTYRAYRPDAANWAVHFDRVDEAVAQAEAIVVAARSVCPLPLPGQPPQACPQLVPAHDALEAVRYAMRELRSHNGFPRLVTDWCTAYHDPMEAMVLSVKGLAADQITDDLLATLAEQASEADFLWRKVEKNPIDAAWGFGAAQEAALAGRIAAERAALDALAEAIAAADRAAIPALGLQLKAAFVPVYTSFAGDPALNKLPQ
jgi:hypothetical protein